MSGVTPNLGLPFVEASDAITDYPALDETRAGLLDRAGLVCIDDQPLAAPAASFDFPGIPQTFAHLQLIIRARTTAGASELGLQFNGDTAAANYDGQRSLVAGAGVSAADWIGTLPYMWLATIPEAAADANRFAQIETLIADYAGAYHKTHRSKAFSPRIATANGLPMFDSGGVWESTAAITRVTVIPTVGTLSIGSRATLYGLGVVGG